MSTEPQSRLDTGEFYEREKRRWAPLVWAFLTLVALGSPIYCVSRLPTEAKVKEISPTRVEFTELRGRVKSLESGSSAFEKRVEKQFSELKKEMKSGFRDIANRIDRVRRKE